MFWTLYLALEPAVRANWPHSLVTWNRVVAGRWKDAQVGSHILVGACIGTGLWIASEIFEAAAGPRDSLNSGLSLWQLLGTRHWIASYASVIDESLLVGLAGFFVVFWMRQLFKKDWLAAVAAAVLFTMINTDIVNQKSWHGVLILSLVYVVLYGALMFVLLRVGLVATIAAVFFLNGVNHICLGSDWKAWYASAGLATIFVLVAVAVFAFWRSLGSFERAIQSAS
jgi:hypothetical protein